MLFFSVFLRFWPPSCALKLTPGPENRAPEASQGVLERLLWLRVALGFVLGPFWVDLVLDFVTFSADSGINFAIFWHRFPTSWMYVCIASCTLCVQPRTEKLTYPGPAACAERLNPPSPKGLPACWITSSSPLPSLLQILPDSLVFSFLKSSSRACAIRFQGRSALPGADVQWL